VCRSKHVEQLRNIGIINSTTRSHIVGFFYEIYIMMHGSMNIKFIESDSSAFCSLISLSRMHIVIKIPFVSGTEINKFCVIEYTGVMS